MEMHQQITLLIGKLAKEWDRLLAGEKISRIDKDILIHDIQQLYEMVHELEVNKAISQLAIDEREVSRDVEKSAEVPEPQKAENPVSSEESPIEKTDEMNQEVQEQNPQELELEVVSQNNDNEQQEEDFDTETSSDRENEKNKIETETGQKSEPLLSASDKFPAAKTLADMYSSNGDKSLVARMQNNRISDLNSAIGINEKFLFINEIFKGNTADYKAAIEKLNHMTHYHDAIEYLEHIKKANKVENQEACSTLIEIIKRKHA